MSVHNPCFVSVPPPLPWPVGCPPNCFVGGTLVAVPTGWAPIERLTVGDLVVAFDFGAGAVVDDRIVGNHHAEESSFVEIAADGEVLRVTSQHPVYEQSRGWTCVRDLARGDHLLSREGVDVEIIEVRHVDQKALVFNLSVQEQRNYFVGSRAILVHNK